MQVGFDESNLIQSAASSRCGSEPERFAREISTYHDSISMRQIQAHLARATPNLDDPRIAGNRAVNQTRELAALGACAQPTQRGAWRVARERRSLIKAAHNLGSRLAG